MKLTIKLPVVCLPHRKDCAPVRIINYGGAALLEHFYSRNTSIRGKVAIVLGETEITFAIASVASN